MPASIEHTLGELLYRDHWLPAPAAPAQLTFRELGMVALDLHLLLFELQMSYGAEYPTDCVGLDDTLGYLVALTALLAPAARAGAGPRPSALSTPRP